MTLGNKKSMTLCSGNNNRPTVNVKLGLVHFDFQLNIYDVMVVFKVLFGLSAFVYWIYSLENKRKKDSE